MQIQIIEGQGKISASSIEIFQRNLKRLSLMVNTVMRLERFKPEDLPIRPQYVYAARLVDQCLDDYQLAASRKHLRLEADVDRTLDMHIDPDLFLDVLGNLIDNAVKYTNEGYVRVEVEWLSESEEVLFKVLDSGPGIAPDRQTAL